MELNIQAQSNIKIIIIIIIIIIKKKNNNIKL